MTGLFLFYLPILLIPISMFNTIYNSSYVFFDILNIKHVSRGSQVMTKVKVFEKWVKLQGQGH